MNIRDTKNIAIWSIAAGLVFIFLALTLFLLKTTEIDFSKNIAPEIFSHYGALVGGVVGTIFSLAGVLLLIQNLNDQERNFQKQQIENRYFELIHIQRNNCNEINLKERSGRKVFIPLLREFYECYRVVTIFNISYIKDEELYLDKYGIINLAYLAFFYGACGESSEEILKNRLKHKFDEAYVDELLAQFKDRQSELEKMKTSGRDEFHYKSFEGHQTRLGHYYRHMYQAVKYIDNQNSSLLSYIDKYQYIKMLRAQLSNQEQALLFFNTLSDLGADWELGRELSDINRRLITKYNFIKNIPHGFTDDINVREFYPNVFYEGDSTKTDERIEYEKVYS